MFVIKNSSIYGTLSGAPLEIQMGTPPGTHCNRSRGVFQFDFPGVHQRGYHIYYCALPVCPSPGPCAPSVCPSLGPVCPQLKKNKTLYIHPCSRMAMANEARVLPIEENKTLNIYPRPGMAMANAALRFDKTNEGFHGWLHNFKLIVLPNLRNNDLLVFHHIIEDELIETIREESNELGLIKFIYTLVVGIEKVTEQGVENETCYLGQREPMLLNAYNRAELTNSKSNLPAGQNEARVGYIKVLKLSISTPRKTTR